MGFWINAYNKVCGEHKLKLFSGLFYNIKYILTRVIRNTCFYLNVCNNNNNKKSYTCDSLQFPVELNTWDSKTKN